MKKLFPATEAMLRRLAVDLIWDERTAQDEKWGLSENNLVYTEKPDQGFNLAVLTEEVGEVAKALVEGKADDELLNELIQVGAVTTAWIQQILRRKRPRVPE